MKFFKIPQLNVWSALLDLVVVILGILVAFTLNNWWQNRNNRSIEQDLLSSLRDEIYINLEEMEPLFNRFDSTLTLTDKLLDYIGPDADELPTDDFWTLISPCLGITTFDATNSVKSSIISNGEIRYIRNDIIQQELQLLPAKLRDYLEDEDFTREEIQNYFKPYIRNIFPTYSLEFRPNHFNISTKNTLRDPKFDSYVGGIRFRQTIMEMELNDYKDHLITLLEAVEIELGIEPTDTITE